MCGAGAATRSGARIRYFRGGGETVEAGNEEEALMSAITKLGGDGRELVAVRQTYRHEGGANSHSYIFKRPR